MNTEHDATTTTNYPTETGCYIDGTHGHYALAVMAERFGNEDDAEIAGAYHNSEGNDQCVIHDTLTMIADRIEDDWNAALPDGLVATWIDGEFVVLTNEEADQF